MSHAYRLTHGAILSRDKIFIAGVLANKDGTNREPHKTVVFETLGQESDNRLWGHWFPDYQLAAMASYELDSKPYLITVGTNGVLETSSGEEVQIDRHETPIRLPNITRPLHALRIIAGKAFVTGACRQVYQRALEEDTWIQTDNRCRLPVEIEHASAFNDIDGSESFLLAVGRHGSMWVGSTITRNGNWCRVDHDLTTVELHAVKNIDKGKFIVAGEKGTIILTNVFDVSCFHQNLTCETFTGIATAFGANFLCTDQGNLFKLTHDALKAVELPFEGSQGGGSLDYADGLLLFVTHKQAAVFDGEHWTIITPC
jgi:hypothetical protein